MPKILICGSRDATPDMLAFVRKLLLRFKRREQQGSEPVEIVVGDAGGIDERVVMQCLALDIWFDLYSAVGKPPRLPRMRENARYWYVDNIPYTAVPAVQRPFGGIDWKQSYLERDRVMCREASSAIGIWNAKSTGTPFTTSYMSKLGKPSILLPFVTPKDWSMSEGEIDPGYWYDKELVAEAEETNW